MVGWRLVYTKQAEKDAKKIARAGLRSKTEAMLQNLSKNPYYKPPSFEKLVGDLEGAYSRRINVQHRLVYQILPEHKVIKIIRMWTHYE